MLMDHENEMKCLNLMGLGIPGWQKSCIRRHLSTRSKVPVDLVTKKGSRDLRGL